jgi:hypothetical protein
MAAVDNFDNMTIGLVSPHGNAFAVTPDNDNDLDFVTRGIYVGASGTLKVDTDNGDTVTFTGIAAGVIHTLRVKKVYATGTSATGIVGLY